MDPVNRKVGREREDSIPPDEAAPGVGAPPRADATGDDPGDAARRAAGADPAAADMDPPNPRSPFLNSAPD